MLLVVITEIGLCFWKYCLQCFDTVGWASGRASGLWVMRCWRGYPSRTRY